jgi:glycosyltransferase involved in cell wall biosynthesis
MNVASASILICTYNRAPLLREALNSIASMTTPHGCDVEIVVVDNNSSDATAQVIADVAGRSPYRIVGLHERAQGKSFALNTGLAAARGDIIALTDDDVWPDREWLTRIVARFRERDVSFVCGKVLPGEMFCSR